MSLQGIDAEKLKQIWATCEELQRLHHKDHHEITSETILREKKTWFRSVHGFFTDSKRQHDDHWWENYGDLLEPLFEFMTTLGSYTKIDELYQKLTAQISKCISCCDEYYRRKMNCLDQKGYAPAIQMVCKNLFSRDQERVCRILEKMVERFEDGLVEESELDELHCALWEVFSHEEFAANKEISNLVCAVLAISPETVDKFVALARERMKSLSSLFSFACCSGASESNIFLFLAAKIHAGSIVRIDEEELSPTLKRFSIMYSSAQWEPSLLNWQGLKGVLRMFTDDSGDITRLIAMYPQLWASTLKCFDNKAIHPEVIEIAKLVVKNGGQQAWPTVSGQFTALSKKILARLTKKMDSAAAANNLQSLLLSICKLSPSIAPLHIDVVDQVEKICQHQANPNAELVSISLVSAIKSVEYAEDAHLYFIERLTARAGREMSWEGDEKIFSICCRAFSLASVAYLREISDQVHSSGLTANDPWATQVKCLQAIGLHVAPTGSYKVLLTSITNVGHRIIESIERHSNIQSVAPAFEQAIMVACICLPLLFMLEAINDEWREFATMISELSEKAVVLRGQYVADELVAKTAAVALLFSNYDSVPEEFLLKTRNTLQLASETEVLEPQMPSTPLVEAFLCFTMHIVGFSFYKDTGVSRLGLGGQKAIALAILQGIQIFRLYCTTRVSEVDFFTDVGRVVHSVCSRDLEPLLALAFLDLAVRIPEKTVRRQLALVLKVCKKCRDMDSEMYTNAVNRIASVLNLNSFGWKTESEDKPKRMRHIEAREGAAPARVQEKSGTVKLASSTANDYYRMPDYKNCLLDVMVVVDSSGNFKCNLENLKRPLPIQERIPTTFKSTKEYITFFWPLLFEELLASLESSLRSLQVNDKTNQEKIKVESSERRDDVLKIFFQVCGSRDDGVDNDFLRISESDVLLLCANSDNGKDSFLPFLLLIDKKVRKENAAAQGQVPTTSYETRVLIRYKEHIKPGCRFIARKLCSFLPNDREFKSLKDVDAIAGVSQILLPNRMGELNRVTSSEEHRELPTLFQRLTRELNSSQIKVVRNLVSLLNRSFPINFMLIQGPPGTGKTSTILALTSALMSMRGKARGIDGSLDTSSHKKSSSILSPKGIKGPKPPKQTTIDRQGTSANRMRILVCAQSNAAVDEILRRLVTRGMGFMDNSGKDSTCNVVRIGNIATCVGDQAREYHIDTLQSRQENDNTALKLQAKYSIIKDADIVCSTLNSTSLLNFASAFNKRIEEFPNFKFDVAIIDEAAQAIEPAALSCLSCLRKGAVCIMVGDPKQLPATILSKRASLLEQSMFLRFQRAGALCYVLNVQYRMHPSISRFPSLHFYQGKLLDGANMASKTQCSFHERLEFGPFVFYDIVRGKQSGRKYASTSLENAAEAAFIIKLLKSLVSVFRADVVLMSIGIITPYRNQAKLLSNKIRENFGSTYNIFIATVDSFQGRELDVVIFSAVRTSIGDNSNIGFLSDVRRMNVALTRAKSCMWIIGNCTALRENSDTDWKALIQFAKSRNSLHRVEDISAWKLSQLDKATSLKKLAKRPLQGNVAVIESLHKRPMLKSQHSRNPSTGQMNRLSGDEKYHKHQSRSGTARKDISCPIEKEEDKPFQSSNVSFDSMKAKRPDEKPKEKRWGQGLRTIVDAGQGPKRSKRADQI